MNNRVLMKVNEGHDLEEAKDKIIARLLQLNSDYEKEFYKELIHVEHGKIPMIDEGIYDSPEEIQKRKEYQQTLWTEHERILNEEFNKAKEKIYRGNGDSK